MESLREFYKIGNGPSSSHTMGPEKAAKELGVEIKIETQGADGIQNELTRKDIEESDAIILALAITPQGMERFEGYDPYEITLKEAIREGKEILEEIVEEIG